MTESTLKLSEIISALKREDLNFKIQNSELNGTEESVIFIDACSKTKLRGKIVRSFNEGEVYHWPLFNHENVARLIDILYIRKNLYIYLTVNHEITLKNIVHDKNFVYDARCFDRKRSYAKGIFSGLSYLHGKSLSLMNLSDDNIIISEIDDTAIITNFNHLTCLNKATKSKLNIPEMYRAPETEKGEFDAIKAEMWASGILMLDVFLAHMVPWAIVDYKPKKVMHIVTEMSLDLLQAANAGSVVTAVDLAKFQAFLKCFFKLNPMNRIPAKYASIASFLQNRSQYEKFGEAYQSTGFSEDTLLLDYSSMKLPEDDLAISLNSSRDSSSSSISPRPQKKGITSIAISPNDSSFAVKQAKRSEKSGKNEKEINLCFKKTSEASIEPQSEKYSTKVLSPFPYKTVDAETSGDLQKMIKSCEALKENIKDVTELNCNRCQSKSLSFVKSKSSDNTIAFQLRSKRSSGYLNTKVSPTKQSVKSDLENSELCLNRLYSNDNNSVVEFDNNPDNNNIDNNSAVESGCVSVETSKNISEISETRNMRNESQIKQRFPYKRECGTSVQTFKKTIAKPPRYSIAKPPKYSITKPPRYSRVPPLLFTKPEIKSVIDKIIFLRKCYISIQTHQRMFISPVFERRQYKLIKEYRILLFQEDLRLCEMLRKEHELKLEDITKLIRCAHLRALPNGNQCENLSMPQNFYEIHQNRFLQTRETRDDTQNDMSKLKCCPDEKFKDMNTLTVRPDRNYSYWRAIEKSERIVDRKWDIIGQLDNEKFKKDCEITNFDLEYKLNQFRVPDTVKKHKVYKENVGGKMNGRVKPHEQAENHIKTVQDAQNGRYARSKEIEKICTENKNKRVEINTEEKIDEIPKKLNRKKINKKTLHALKKEEKPKRPWFFSMCPGGRIEE